LVVDWMPVTRVVFVVVAVVAFALGYAGLDDYLGGQPGHGVLDLIYYDLQLFVLDSAPLQAGGPFPPALEVARFAAPAATAYALAAAVQAILARQLELLRVRRARGHTIVCGAQVHAGFLAQQLRAAGQRVVLIDPAPATRMAVSPPPPGVWHVVGDPRDPAMLRRAGAARAREVVAITSDSAVNAEVAVAMRELASTRRANPVHCFAEVNDRELCAALVAQTLIAHDAPHLRLEFFNQHDRAARSLVDRYPLPGDQDSPPCVLVAGAGRLGQAVVAELARRWDQQRSHGAPPLNLCVLDAKVSAEHLLERIPFVRAVATFHARAADPAEVTSVATLMVPDSTGAVRPPTHVYVCLGSDDDGMAFGLTALRLLSVSNPRPELRVVIAVTNSTVFGRVLTTPASSMPSLGPSQLCLHNVVETVYSIDVMRRGIVEDIAKAVHERYVRAAQAKGDTVETNPSMAHWEGLPEHLKESNRSQVADIGNKLRSINCAVVPTTDAAPFAFRDDEVDRLARLEHERWLQERTQQGWRYGSVRDDQRKLHPDLVDWADLSDESAEKDRDAVQNIPRLLRAAGFQILRLEQ
jgi:voltage-gated potassium channel Kch